MPVTASAATMESGQTPIIVWWDYLLASEIGPSVKSLKIVIPSDASYPGRGPAVRRHRRPGRPASAEAAALAPGASVEVSLPAQPVLVASRRVS